MSRFLFVVFTAPKEDREDEYNEWYDGRHLNDTVGVPGIVSGERFVLADVHSPGADLPKYLALYEIETDDIATIPRALEEARVAGQMPSSEALDRSSIRAAFYKAIPAGPSERDP
jgi:hypothetical protein